MVLHITQGRAIHTSSFPLILGRTLISVTVYYSNKDLMVQNCRKDSGLAMKKTSIRKDNEALKQITGRNTESLS